MFDSYNQQTNDCDINGQTTLLELEEMLHIWGEMVKEESI